MRAVTYTRPGDPDVLHVVDRPVRDPAEAEVRVRVVRAGVNPTDWKSRRGGLVDGIDEQVPGQDGAGVVDAVGPGVDPARVGERVWVWEAAFRRADGTSQEQAVVPAHHAVPLPDHVDFDHGASLGIPALTAHRLLTVRDDGPARLTPGALDGLTVLVHGGAGAVGQVAIQLARWAGAEVVTTISSEEKAALARRAGAHHVVNYRTQDVAAAVREVAPDGVPLICEVSPAANAAVDHEVAAQGATIAFYADDGGGEVTFAVREAMVKNLRWQGVLVYLVPDAAKADGVAAVSAALADGALHVGEEHGLTLHHYPLERLPEAHAVVEDGVVGKVLVAVSDV